MRLCFSFQLLYTFNLLFPSVNSSQGKTHNKPASLAARMLTLDSSCTSQMCALEILNWKLVTQINRWSIEWFWWGEGQIAYFLIYLFILGAPGLCCRMWDFIFRPEIEPGSLALGVQSLSHWTTREVPKYPFSQREQYQRFWQYLWFPVWWINWSICTQRWDLPRGCLWRVRHCSWLCSLQGFPSFPGNLGLPLWLRW